jgi:HD-GYP domain-containing protein (c-di-GMP phosphodiesterase class II)
MLAGGNTTMTLIELMNSGDQDDPLFFHALNTSVLSMMMGKELNLSADDLQVLGLGALAHDIGMVSLPLELRLTSGGFAKVGANVGIHIERGLQLVDRIPDFPEPSRAIIAQHHERLNGTGYPNRLLDSEISLLTKIVMIVDVYDDLCNNPEQSRNLTPAETLSYLYQNLSGKRQGELRDDLLVTLIKILGVYPPGTMVELSDSSIGVVINVDSENRTRPQVLMYSPNVPKDEAVIVDLAEVENLKIQRSLRPPQVKREILNFLSPQRMIGFFPSSAEILASSTQPSLVGAT